MIQYQQTIPIIDHSLEYSLLFETLYIESWPQRPGSTTAMSYTLTPLTGEYGYGTV